MDKAETILKISISAIGTLISYIVDGIGLAFAVLLGMMVLDFITGLMVGAVNKELSSSTGWKGFVKKMYVIILIAAIYMLGQAVDGFDYLGDGVTITYIIIEFISITENGGKLGVPMPSAVRNVIETLKGDEDNDKAV